MEEPVKEDEKRKPKAGDRIRFLKTLEEDPDPEEGFSPYGNHYATEGDLGTVERVGGFTCPHFRISSLRFTSICCEIY